MDKDKYMNVLPLVMKQAQMVKNPEKDIAAVLELVVGTNVQFIFRNPLQKFALKT